jgi:carboxyl-terminal processing protease
VGYNSYLKYTTAKYYTPSGRCVQSRNYATMRNEGSVTTVPDSLISEFRTRAGRKVYDGGGIVPDVKIEPQYVSRFAVTLYAMGLMEDWADRYMRTHHTDKIDVRSFSITDEDYADFCRFIADKEIPYESETRQALKTLERAMERDRYNESLGEAVEQLKAQLKDDKLSNMQTYRGEIVDALNSDIVMRHAYNEGVQERIAATDEEVDRAIELILNAEEYQRILTSQDVEKR